MLCEVNVLDGPQREDAAEPTRYKQHERPCPACRNAVSRDKIFSRSTFEPASEELADKDIKAEDGDDDVVMLDVKYKVPKPARPVQKRKAKAQYVLDSDEEEDNDGDDDDMSDFIVQSDEDKKEKSACRELKKHPKGKGNQNVSAIFDDEDDDIIFGAKPDKPPNGKPINLMSKFLPSTKMKVSIFTFSSFI
jgi:hypothetical protein